MNKTTYFPPDLFLVKIIPIIGATIQQKVAISLVNKERVRSDKLSRMALGKKDKVTLIKSPTCKNPNKNTSHHLSPTPKT